MVFSHHLPLPKEPQTFGMLYNKEKIITPCKSIAVKELPINHN
jgi:hypothetical protein